MAESTSSQSYQFPHPQCISLDYLKSINACISGIDSYMNALRKAYTITGVHPKLSQIAEHISLSDILWILGRVDTEKRFSTILKCDFAEHVLHIFENRYPEDDRPRKAIQASRSIVSAAAYDADAYAYAAADADAAAYAAYAADVAYDVYDAYDVAYDAAYAYADDAAKQKEQTWQKSHLIKLLIQLETNTIDWNRKSLAEFTE